MLSLDYTPPWNLQCNTCYVLFVPWYLLTDTCYLILVTWCLLPDSSSLKLVSWYLFTYTYFAKLACGEMLFEIFYQLPLTWYLLPDTFLFILVTWYLFPDTGFLMNATRCHNVCLFTCVWVTLFFAAPLHLCTFVPFPNCTYAPLHLCCMMEVKRVLTCEDTAVKKLRGFLKYFGLIYFFI